MNRKILVAVLSGATVLAVGAASFFLLDARKTSTPGPALWLSFDAPTRPDWIARVTPLAGAGLDGVVDGAGPASRFSDPFGAAVDFHGNVFVTDGGDGNRILRIGPDGRVTTFAGTRAGFIDGPAASAAFDTPSALAIDRLGNLYVADTGNDAIPRIDKTGAVTTLTPPVGAGATARWWWPTAPRCGYLRWHRHGLACRHGSLRRLPSRRRQRPRRGPCPGRSVRSWKRTKSSA